MVSLVKHAPGIAVKEEAFDQHDWLFNVQNGTVDLKTGTLHPHDRTQLLSTISPVKFDPRATCPEWLKFLDRVMLGRQEIVNFMQRLFGYCASASTAEQAFVVHYGTGANGKSTALDVIKRIFGSYAETTPFATFAEKKNGATPNDLASIHKSRLVIASEGERTTKLAESMIKTVTGNEEVSARYLYKDYFTFRPRFTLMLQSNHKPIIQDTGKGIWRRVRFVPWEYVFPDSEMDKNWAEKEVAAEGPGILAWVVRGALEYRRMGLAEPEVVKAAVAEYREGEDVLGRWIREECTAIPDHDAPAGGLYSVYRNYMQATGETAIKDREFKAELIKRGFRWRHTKKGNFYTGLKSGIIEVV
jgi:putative DNA primase/helicase